MFEGVNRHAVYAVAALGAGAVAFFGGSAAGAGEASKRATQWPAKVSAHYGIFFNGFDIGDFRLQSTVADGRYVLDGDAELSALLGVFKWRGMTRSSGRLAGSNPRPEGYIFNFRSSDKVGRIGMSFGKSGVKSVSMVPQIPVAAGEIPVRAHHLKGVSDPLSAVMELARGVKGNPCGAKLKVFDGKQRFDLVLSYRRREMLPTWQTGGRAVPLHVCGVKYRPIAGFKRNQAVSSLEQAAGLEVAMRKLPGTKLFIPHQITIPTLAGSVVLSAKKIDVLPAGSRRVAQVR